MTLQEAERRIIRLERTVARLVEDLTTEEAARRAAVKEEQEERATALVVESAERDALKQRMERAESSLASIVSSRS